MYRCSWILLLASNLSTTSLSEESSRKHHRKHRKHHHSHEGHMVQREPMQEHVSWKASNRTHTEGSQQIQEQNIVNSPRENVATKVVAHANDTNTHAFSTLNKVHISKVVTSSKDSAADGAKLEDKLSKLQQKIDLEMMREKGVDQNVPRDGAAPSEIDDVPQGVAVDAPPEEETDSTPVAEKGIDIDTAMPYGELEPFGREDTAQELTEDSVRESDEMVDQLERAEVAEEKRAVFRALTRLRGAAITSFDGIARSQTGNIDEYNKLHKWRRTHPLHHLADEESDISKWAFPDNADF